MDVDVAAEVLAGSILTGMAFVVFIITVVVINNILHKYWKPVKIFTADSWNFNPPHRFTEPQEAEKIPPTLGEEKKV
jgi:hypothetical protein